MAVQHRASGHRQLRWLAGTSLALGLLLPLPPLQAAERDDRPAIETFVTTGTIASRSLQDDLGRSRWSPKELRAAIARAYGVSTVGIDRFLETPAAAALLQRQLPWWSSELAPAIRLAALKAAIVADSRDGSISLLGLLQRLPVRFALADAPVAVRLPASSCGCPQACGGSALAHLAFLIACLQAGSTAPAN